MVEFSTKGFMSNVGRSRGKFSRWKEAGSTVGFIHPGLRIHGRRAHGIIPVVLVKDGKEEPANKRFNCAVQATKEDERITREQEAACPLCSLVPSRFTPAAQVYVLDTSTWSVDYLRPIQMTTLAKTGDSERRQILAEYTLAAQSPEANAKIHTTTTS